ncbi:MAG: hypothetical protein K0R54_820 [Clostridiaceae bacterium]|jgi:hypothetical protein|nr:hypothetical protein [Clostridiaceae bacterium]
MLIQKNKRKDTVLLDDLLMNVKHKNKMDRSKCVFFFSHSYGCSKKIQL